MKRKIFSKLLMGALLIASVSSFVSCKDYDDDINANKTEIATLKSSLEKQIADLNTALSTYQAQANAAHTQYENALKAAQEAANAANADLKQALSDAVNNAANTYATKSDLNAAIADKATTDALSKAVNELRDALTAAMENKDAALKSDLEKQLAAAIANFNSEISKLRADRDKDIAASRQAQAELRTALEAAINSLTAKIDENKGSIDSEIAALKLALEGVKSSYATKEDLQNAIEKISNLSGLQEIYKVQLENALANAARDLTDAKAELKVYAEQVASAAAAEAAAQAKAEAIAEAAKMAESLQNSKADKAELDDAVAKLIAKINGVDENLNHLIGENATAIANNATAITEVLGSIENIELQIVALQKFQKSMEALGVDKFMEETAIALNAIEVDLAKKYKSLVELNKETEAAVLEQLEQVRADLQSKLDEAGNTSAQIKKQLSDEIAAVDARISALTVNDIDGLNAKLAKIDENIANLAARATANEGKFDALAGGVEVLTANVNGIDARLITIEGQVVTLTEKVSTLESTLSQVQSDLEAAQAAIIANAESFASALATAEESLSQEIADEISAYDKKLAQAITNLVSGGDAAARIRKAAANSDTPDEAAQALMNAFNNISNIGENLSVIQGVATKLLTSVVLRPNYYSGGIEAIEAPALVNHGTWALTAGALGTSTETFAFDGMTPARLVTIYPEVKAYYHINPIGADIEGYTAQFYTNNAQTRSIGGVDGFAKLRFGNSPVTNYTLSGNDLKKYYANGILTVPFEIDRADLPGAPLKPFIAFELTKTEKDAEGNNVERNVTSDYALVEPSDYANLVLADYDRRGQAHNPGQFHLNQTFIACSGEATDITSTTTGTVHRIAYNATKDLDDIVRIHYDYTTPWSVTPSHREMTVSQAKNILGLTVEYTNIRYTKGTNVTREDQHMSIDENNVVTPRNVKADGTTDVDHEANASAVGREPIFRATLKNNDGKILAIGYIKFKIVKPGDEPTTEPKKVAFTMNDYYMNCNTSDYLRLTWNQVEYEIYNNLLGISKADFEADYKFQEDVQVIKDAAGNYIALGKTTSGYTFPTRAAGTYTISGQTLTGYTPKKIGEVDETVDATDPTTNILRWAPYQTLPASYYTPDQLSSLTSVDMTTGLSAKDLTVDVVFIKTADVAGINSDSKFQAALGNGAILVHLTIPAGKLHYAVGDLNNSAKIPSYWYGQNSSTLGKFEIHDNIIDVDNSNAATKAVAGDGAKFDLDMLGTFEGGLAGMSLGYDSHFNNPALNTVEFKFTWPVNGTNAQQLNATYEPAPAGTGVPAWRAGSHYWTVKGNSGATYTLYVKDTDDTNVYAAYGTTTAEVIASLTGGNQQNLVLNPASAAVKDIINYYGKAKGNNEYLTADNKAFTLFIEANAPTGCYKPFIKNKFFNVRVLRPLNMVRGNGGSVIDASPNAADHIVKIQDLVNLYDWRDVDMLKNGTISHEKYTAASKDRFWYYYGSAVPGAITKIEVDYTFSNWYTDNSIYVNAADKLGNVADVDVTTKLRPLTSVFSTLTPVVNQMAFDTTADNKLTAGSGTIQIPNIGATTEVFHIYVPITLTYNWGTNTQKVYGVITINKTTASARRR